MTLSSGTQLGPFEILELIGVGGMGEVYRARDTKLGREVAIKVLPEAFADDPERFARFDREAKLLAALDHPNIGALYEFRHDNGVHFLVMQLVEGDTLADRIARGPLDIDEALAIFAQIAEALEAAHEESIVHRDLKPGNIKITEDHRAIVIDFGIARADSRRPMPGAPTLTPSPSGETPRHGPDATTLPSTPAPDTSVTTEGMLLGTPSYMSPEQARGKRVDKRADIWAFGCCLYQALTAEKLFEGATVADTIKNVLGDEPNWKRLPRSTPARIRNLLRRCLEKDPRRRLRDMGDAWFEITEALAGPSEEELAELERRSTRAKIGVGVFLFVAVTAALLAVNLIRVTVTTPIGHDSSTDPRQAHGAQDRSVYRFTIDLLPGQFLGLEINRTMELSPSGDRVVYSGLAGGALQLYGRDFNRGETYPIEGSAGASTPFFSPDGQWIAFRRALAGKAELVKIPASGGTPQLIVEVPGLPATSQYWCIDDMIYYNPAPSEGIWRVSPSGGEPEKITTIDRSRGELLHGYARVLPDKKTLIFTSMVRGPASIDYFVEWMDLQTGERDRLLEGSFASYLPTGHLLYVGGGSAADSKTLMAVPFDVEDRMISGLPRSVVSGILVHPLTGFVHYSIAANGTLAFVPSSPKLRELIWIDRHGKDEGIQAPARPYLNPRISPDGRRVAVTVGQTASDVWIYDLERDVLSPFTRNGSSSFPNWTTDGRYIVLASFVDAEATLFRMNAQNVQETEVVFRSPGLVYPSSISADGRLAWMYVEPADTDVYSIRTSPMNSDGRIENATESYFNTGHVEGSPSLSPNGEWIAYHSAVAGGFQVYVAAIPGPGEIVQISDELGASPVWSKDGSELFYLNGNKMMRVEVDTEAGLRVGVPETLFEADFATTDLHFPANYDVSADGQRFLMVRAVKSASDAKPMTEIKVVVNWIDELERLVPVGDE